MAPPSDNLRRAVGGARKRIEGFPRELDTALMMVKWTAESLEGAHEEEKVDALRAATRDLAGLHESLRLHIMALSEVESGRLAPSEDQSFAETLHSQTMEMAAQDPRAPEEHEAFKAFNKAVWVINHEDEPMPGEEEEDIVMTSRDLVANAQCPLTMRAVEELTEPVCARECRHIYEAADARAYFGSRGRSCAVAGCNKDVTVSSLISDSKLLRDLQELMRNKRGGRSTQREEEYTALDEEED